MFKLTSLIALVAALCVAAPASGAQREPRSTLDGYVLGHVPPGVGPNVDDFSYEQGDDPASTVAFHKREWERGPDAEGAYHVDFTVEVLRGKRLSDPVALRAFLAEYLERHETSWEPHTFTGRPGYIGADDAFFLDDRGVAVYARLDTPGADRRDLIRFMDEVHRDA